MILYPNQTRRRPSTVDAIRRLAESLVPGWEHTHRRDFDREWIERRNAEQERRREALEREEDE